MRRAALESWRRADLLPVGSAAFASAAVGVWWARTLTQLTRGWQALYMVYRILIGLVAFAASILLVTGACR